MLGMLGGGTFCLLLLLALGCVVQGDVYVSERGVDFVGCGDVGDPCGSIQKGIEVACSNSSVTVWVEPGNYTQEELSIYCNVELRWECTSESFGV